MSWSFTTLQNEIEGLEEDIDRCNEMVELEYKTIEEMNKALGECSFNYLRDEIRRCPDVCDGCGKDDNGEIWGKRFIRESRSEIRRYKKLLKWKMEVLETMQKQPKHIRSVA
jgi:predicted RNase H-like nuclease (RuvC/YqgF family)|tara:strand:+ start:677 stop:1012 length:336 start_codon:yes stop_codon:yes gene_type:complete